MALFNIFETECGFCGNKLEYAKWHYIDAKEIPEAVPLILNNDLFYVPCKNCELGCYLDFPVVYNDPERHFIVSFITEPYDHLFLAQYLYKAYDSNNGDTSIYRVTTARETFREKILINRCGYDDRIIEIMKCIMFGQSKTVFSNIKYDGTEFCSENGINFLHQKGDIDIKLRITYELYEEMKKRFGEIVKKPEYNKFHVFDMKWGFDLLAEHSNLAVDMM